MQQSRNWHERSDNLLIDYKLYTYLFCINVRKLQQQKKNKKTNKFLKNYHMKPANTHTHNRKCLQTSARFNCF